MSERNELQRSGRRLRRSEEDRMIAGVCGGLAEYFGWSATRVRIVYTIVSVLSAAFPGIAVYIILWLVMPSGGRRPIRFSLDDRETP